ncbi:MAG: hypothetical protein ACL93V_03660 [Candidatus Electrothrix sp. YB6]
MIVEKIFNIIVGICGLLAFAITIGGIYYTFVHIPSPTGINKDLIKIIYVLGTAIVTLVASFLFLSFISFYYIIKLQEKLGKLPIENKQQEGIIISKQRMLRNITASLHNITHHHRNIIILLEGAINDLKEDAHSLDDKKCEKICNKFERYICLVLMNINSTMSVMTQDECSTCIKIIKDNKVKTYFRDSNSYRERRYSDYTQKGEYNIYDISENTAFHSIADPNTKASFFVSDNLEEYSNYDNKNPNWKTLYNATIVVPIQFKIKEIFKNEAYVVGFICCDNFRGRFESKEVKDFLSSIGDSLYSLFFLYDCYYKLCTEKGFNNGRLRKYGKWDIC